MTATFWSGSGMLFQDRENAKKTWVFKRKKISATFQVTVLQSYHFPASKAWPTNILLFSLKVSASVLYYSLILQNGNEEENLSCTYLQKETPAFVTRWFLCFQVPTCESNFPSWVLQSHRLCNLINYHLAPNKGGMDPSDLFLPQVDIWVALDLCLIMSWVLLESYVSLSWTLQSLSGRDATVFV